MTFHIRLRRYRSGPIACPRPLVVLRVRTQYGDAVPLRFSIDTGADLTAIPIPVAEQHGLPFTRSDEGTAVGLVGSVRKYRGTIHAHIAGREYHWPCNFLEPPTAPGAAGEAPLPVLGRAGFLDAFDICISGGYLKLTRRSRFRDWRQGLWRRLRSVVFAEHAADAPL